MIYAGFWIRFSASVVDFLVSMLFFVPVIALAGMGWERLYNDGVAAGIGLIANALVGWLYYALFESSRWQATPGKRLLELRVTDLFGNRTSFGQASGRDFSKIFSSLIFGIGYLMAAFTEKKQCLHDKVASTLVLRGIAGTPIPAFIPTYPTDYSHAQTVYVPRPQASRWVMSGFDDNGHVVRLTFSQDNPKLEASGLLIGRDAKSCDLHMNDPSVSRRHARFFTEQGTLWVEDLASANGTMVNGRAVKKNSPTELPDQGEVSFGAVILTTAKY